VLPTFVSLGSDIGSWARAKKLSRTRFGLAGDGKRRKKERMTGYFSGSYYSFIGFFFGGKSRDFPNLAKVSDSTLFANLTLHHIYELEFAVEFSHGLQGLSLN